MTTDPRSISTTTRWLLLGALLAVPYLVLAAVGTVWLWERGWMWWWLALNVTATLAGWRLMQVWRSHFSTAPPRIARVEPDPRWAPAGEAAWKEIEAIAQRVQGEDLPLGDLQRQGLVVREVLDAVAKQYRPQSREPALEIPVPYVLRVVELVSADLREAFSKTVPGAHIWTLRDFQRMQKAATVGRRAYTAYRLLRFGFNPLASLLSEFRELAGGRLAEASTAEIKRWAIGFFVRKTGYYAVQLYSGQLVLSDVELQQFHSDASRRDAQRAERRDEAIESEPLRILVLGQVKAGKSSLINALFGEVRAEVDVVPRTKFVEPYVLERDGMRRAIILDTAGFAEGGSRQNPFEQLRDEVLKSDLVLMVCSAASAARAPDRQLLDELRALYQREPNRVTPPIVVALSHVDRLRPWQEWDPPYDLNRATDGTPASDKTDKTAKAAKAANIAAAIRATAEDLQTAADSIVPVCLEAGRIYNVDDVLAPTILLNLDAARRVQYQRCLRQHHDEQYWRRLWEQATNSGRLLWKSVAPSGGDRPA